MEWIVSKERVSKIATLSQLTPFQHNKLHLISFLGFIHFIFIFNFHLEKVPYLHYFFLGNLWNEEKFKFIYFLLRRHKLKKSRSILEFILFRDKLLLREPFKEQDKMKILSFSTLQEKQSEIIKRIKFKNYWGSLKRENFYGAYNGASWCDPNVLIFILPNFKWKLLGDAGIIYETWYAIQS